METGMVKRNNCERLSGLGAVFFREDFVLSVAESTEEQRNQRESGEINGRVAESTEEQRNQRKSSEINGRAAESTGEQRNQRESGEINGRAAKSTEERRNQRENKNQATCDRHPGFD